MRIINNPESSSEIHDPFEGMPEEDVAELLDVFFDDISEKLIQLSNLFLDLEEYQDNVSTVNTILQLYHSIKGTGGTFGYPAVSAIAHKFESLFEKVRDKSLEINAEFIDKLLQSLDLFKQLCLCIKSRSQTGSFEHELLDILGECFGEESKAPAPQSAPLPPVVQIDKRIDEFDDYVKLKSRKIDKLVSLSSELVLRKHIDVIHSKELKEVTRLLKNIERSITGAEEQFNNNASFHESHNKTVELRYDLHEVKTKLRHSVKHLHTIAQENQNWNEHAAKLINELQSEVLQARMVTVNDFFRQLKRTFRDLEKKSEKKVRLQITGLDTEIDRRIIEEIKDPVVHLLRNAFDHGIETPEERRAAGKPEHGTIKVSAQPRGNEVILVLEDDGGGIDAGSVKQSALKKGLFGKKDLDRMTQREALNIIFQPGFSTRTEISQVSGRGVGLDVVKSNIEKIRGFIHVETQPGSGTSFTLRIPNTLASFQAVFCRVGVFCFYIQSSAVARVVRIAPDYPRPEGKINAISIHNTTMPYACLADFFSIRHGNKISPGTYLVILRAGKNCVAIEVDDCYDQQDIVIKPKADLISRVQYIAGVSILPDGTLAYVLEPAEIITRCEKDYSLSVSQCVWTLDNVLDDLSDVVRTQSEESQFIGEDTEAKLILLHFIWTGRHYGIPVSAIDRVCNLADTALVEHLGETFDSFLIFSDDKVSLKRKDELSDPFKSDARHSARAAVIVYVNTHKCLLVPDHLVNVSITDDTAVTLLEKSGKWKASIPDIVLLENT